MRRIASILMAAVLVPACGGDDDSSPQDSGANSDAEESSSGEDSSGSDEGGEESSEEEETGSSDDGESSDAGTDSESGDDGTDSESGSTGEETTGDGETDGESDESGETGEMDGRPVLESPAEAEDLDPSPDVVHIKLKAEPYTYEIGGEMVEGYAYNGQVPGPTIRVQQGNKLIVDFTNGLDEATTIHWHGLDVPFIMDGVPWKIDPVGAGETYRYEFEVKQAGTFWYHPHVDTDRQADLGLYGVLVSEDPADPPVDREVIAVFDSWAEYKPLGNYEHGLHGNDMTWTINGLRHPVLRAKGGERIRLRTVNVANAGYLDLRWLGMRLIASDQGILPRLYQPTSELLTPGDRFEAELLIGNEGFNVWHDFYSLYDEATTLPPEMLFSVEIEEGTAAQTPDGSAWPFTGEDPTADPPYTDIVYTFHGDLTSDTWLINGEAFPDITIEEVPLGSRAVVEIRNLSPSNHPFHMHGQIFEVLSVDGVAPPYKMLEDTINVAIRSTVRLLVYADNPGDWMTHCHILPHAHHGMMTVFRVLDGP